MADKDKKGDNKGGDNKGKGEDLQSILQKRMGNIPIIDKTSGKSDSVERDAPDSEWADDEPAPKRSAQKKAVPKEITRDMAERTKRQAEQKAREEEALHRREEASRVKKAEEEKERQFSKELVATQEKTEVLKAELKRLVDEREARKKQRDSLEDGLKANETRIDSILTEIRGKITELQTGEKPIVEAPKHEEEAPKAAGGGLMAQILGGAKLKSKPKDETPKEKAEAAPEKDPMMAALQERLNQKRKGITGKAKKPEAGDAPKGAAKFVPSARKKAETSEEKVAEEHKKIQEIIDNIKRVHDEISKMDGSIATLKEHNQLQSGVISDLEKRKDSIDERYQTYINAKEAATKPKQAASIDAGNIPAAPGDIPAAPGDIPPPPPIGDSGSPEAPPFDAPPMEGGAPEAPPFDAPPLEGGGVPAAPPIAPSLEESGPPVAPPFDAPPFDAPPIGPAATAAVAASSAGEPVKMKAAPSKSEKPVQAVSTGADKGAVMKQLQNRGLFKSINEVLRNPNSKHFNAVKAALQEELGANVTLDKIDVGTLSESIQEKIADTYKESVQQVEAAEEKIRFAAIAEKDRQAKAEKERKRQSAFDEFLKDVKKPEPQKDTEAVQRLDQYRKESPKKADEFADLTAAKLDGLLERALAREGVAREGVAKAEVAPLEIAGVVPPVPIAVAKETVPEPVPVAKEIATEPTVTITPNVVVEKPKPSDETKPIEEEQRPEVTARIEELKQRRETEEKRRGEFLVQSRAAQQSEEIDREIKSRDEVRREEQAKSEALEREKKSLDQKRDVTLAFDHAPEKEAKEQAVVLGVGQMQVFEARMAKTIEVYQNKHRTTETRKVLGFSVGSDQNVKRDIATYIQSVFLKIIDDHVKNKKLLTDKEVNGLIKDIDHQIKRNKKAHGVLPGLFGKGELAPLLEEIKGTLEHFKKTKEFIPPKASIAKKEGPKLEDQ